MRRRATELPESVFELASPDVFSRWIYTLARKEEKIDTQTLTIDAKEMRLDDEQEVPTEIRL